MCSTEHVILEAGCGASTTVFAAARLSLARGCTYKRKNHNWQMCGRYRLKNPQAVAEALRKFGEGELTAEEIQKRYNMAPAQLAKIFYESGSKIVGREMRWGLVPYWERSEKPKLAPINARSGEAFAKPIFRQAIQKRRCLVPVDAFYEWPKIETGFKQPHCYSLLGERPFFFAGIYENAVEGLRPATFTIFTTEPNELLLKLPHERMPVILENARAKEWMQEGPITETTFKELCATYPAEKMQSWPVSTLINRPGNEGPMCSEPVAAESFPAPKAAPKKEGGQFIFDL